jgi:kinesin family protein 6/9
LKEAKYINLSLHYLEQVIIALHEQSLGKRSHIPYRNSMMTTVLRDSLGGNCMTTMIATCAIEDQLIDVNYHFLIVGIYFYMPIRAKSGINIK